MSPAARSRRVRTSASKLFTLMGFAGMYTLLSILFLFLVFREVDRGPEVAPGEQAPAGAY